jgi:molybdopterin-containing oxidoreductase family iron-sulfur binding subunit
MSCDENKEARAKDRVRRSLPIVADDRGGRSESRPWRSLDERAGSPSVALAAVNEFPAGASELEGVSRRSFMQLVGASTALATVGAACRKPNDKIIPFIRKPLEVTPGNPLHFATATALDGYASGLLVESHEGRPTKIEGNPDHPETLGSSSVFEQAMIAGLYDTDRAKQIRSNGQPVAWRPLVAQVAAHAAQLAKNDGAGLRFLVEPSASPLLGDLRRRILERFPKAKFVAYSSLSGDGAAEGTRLAFGKPLLPRHRLDKARVIVSLDADFLGEGPEHTRLMREFSARREPGEQMNRLYVVEPAVTITGGMADHRLRVRGGDVAALAAALAAAVGAQVPALAPFANFPAPKGVDPKWVAAMAADLARNRSASIVIAGRRQPAAVHALAAAINVALGNEGSTVSYAAPMTPDATSGAAALGTLVEDIAAGTVDTLVITAYNPVYAAPADFKLGQLLARVPNIIYTGLYEDETAAVATTFVPAAHPLESWGDARALDGTTSIVQPLIAPLWGGIVETEVLATFLPGGGGGAHEQVRQYWQTQSQAGGEMAFDGNWEKWLADGVVPGTAAAPESAPAVKADAVAAAVGSLVARKPEESGAGLEIGFVGDPKVYDGRFANNNWLQELPHPITKLTWDNAVLISEATAHALDVETGDVVEIESRGRKVEGPIVIAPGHADEAITLSLGYGRFRGGEGHGGRRGAISERVARGVGFNAGLLRESAAPWFDRGAKLTKVRSGFKLAVTQEHWGMSPDGRAIPKPAVAAKLADVQNESSEFYQELEQRRGPLPTIHAPVDYSGQQYKWAMAIDLSKCTGCNACTVACQAENNIPTVGKENVAKSREMHWIRIDRYFEGPVADPQMISQPVPCMHCETAPCEYVCPVNATVHSDEGLNDMAYNRCIGTRYCSNNCPYKVRRFNFLDYTSETPTSRRLGMNPDVTVRSRGVMEKCTYCVQRIERKRIDTRIEGRAIADGELLTACQQTCPAQAITFGSLNDPGSKVSRLHADPRRYDLLHELGTRPRTAYLLRVRNPNPDMPPAPAEGKVE